MVGHPRNGGPHSKNVKNIQAGIPHADVPGEQGTYAVRGLDPDKQMEKDWHLWHRETGWDVPISSSTDTQVRASTSLTGKGSKKTPLIPAPVNGKRQFRVDGKLDPTYSAGVSLFAEWVANRHREQSAKWPWFLPAKSFTSADAGDGLNYCHTPACEKEFRTVSDQSFYMVNQAAKAIRQLGKVAAPARPTRSRPIRRYQDRTQCTCDGCAFCISAGHHSGRPDAQVG